jgi:outer membrane protein W
MFVFTILCLHLPLSFYQIKRLFMKNLIVFGMLFFALGASAQSGTWYAGGAVGISSIKSSGSDGLTTWRFAPEVGTFISDNIQIGLAVNLQGANSDFLEKRTGATLYGRHFFKAGEAFRPFIGASLPFAKIKDTTTPGSTFEDTSIGLGLTGGFGYTIAPRWTVVGSLGFLNFTRQTESKVNFINLGFDTLGNPFDIGIYYTIVE